jgi:hypothetical protein
MSYTNNVYIPYVDGFHEEEKFLFYKKYYNDIGFNVKKASYDFDKDINYIKLINETIKNEEILILIDYIIIPPFSLHQSIELCKEHKCFIKPSNKMYMIKEESQINKIIDSMIKEEILENFYYDYHMSYKVWPLDGSLIAHKDSFNMYAEKNSLIDGPLAYDFDICYKQYISNALMFLESDSYKFDPIQANPNSEVMFVYKNYLESLINLFGFSNKAYLYKNQIIEELDHELCKNVIFNIEEYFSSGRYI